jgi:hypothetical protein
MMPLRIPDIIRHITHAGVSILDYDDIPQVNLINKQWHIAVTNTINLRKELISKHIFLDMPSQVLNEHEWVWNKLGTACCFVDRDNCPYEHYPTLFRAQLSSDKESKPITIFNTCLYNCSYYKEFKYTVEGSGLTKRYIYSPKSQYPCTCFIPFFNDKGESVIYVSKAIYHYDIIMYNLNSKGKGTDKRCLIKDNDIVTSLAIKDDYSHIIAFQCATIKDDGYLRTFIFDDAASKRMEQSPEILALIKQSTEYYSSLPS